MPKRFFAVFAVLASIATSCGGGQQAGDGGEDGGEAGEAQTYTVNVDGKSDNFNLATLAYFPNQLSVHPGDTIEFKEIFTGEPHTVTFGKLVDAALTAVDKMAPPGGAPGAGPTGGSPAASPTGGSSTASPAGASPGATPTSAGSPGTGGGPAGELAASPGAGPGGPPAGGPPPELMKLPDVFGPPPTFAPLNQSAGQACFLDTGEPPVSPAGGAAACPKVEQPEFNGNQAFFNSGFLAEDETFTMKFADNISPGDYSFMCLVHREGMRGKLTVAEAAADIPAPDEVEDKGREELAKREQALTGVKEEIDKASADKAAAGAGSPEVMDALVAEFGPKEVSIPTGGTVTWNVFLFHTIALNGPEDAVGDLVEEQDGTIRLNEKATAPSKAPKPPPIVFGPGGKPSTTTATWDGTGYFNSGTLASFPGAEVTYRVRFTRAGTYQLQCNLHPDMEGTVKVG